MHPLLLGVWLAEPEVSFLADKSCCEKKHTTKPNKARNEGLLLELLLELFEAEALLLGPTCDTGMSMLGLIPL